MARRTKRTSTSRRGGLFGLGLGEVTKTFAPNKLMEIAKAGGMMLLGYVGANVAGQAVAKIINKDEQNPQGFKKYINALTQGAVACICVSMGGKRVWLKNASYGASLSAVQNTIETISGKSVLDMFKKNGTNGMGAIAGSEELVLPTLSSAEDTEIEGIDDEIEGIDDEIEGIDDEIEGIDDEVISGADDEIEGIDDDYDDGISGEIYE